MADEKTSRMRWQDLNGRERYRVIELLRKQEVPATELCKTFGVSRQTLYRAATAVDQAALAALTPKRRGRKPETLSRQQVRQLERQQKKLEQRLERMSQRYEIAQALLDLQRQAERGERLPGEKKTRRSALGSDPALIFGRGPQAGLADGDDGAGTCDQPGGGDGLAAPPGRSAKGK